VSFYHLGNLRAGRFPERRATRAFLPERALQGSDVSSILQIAYDRVTRKGSPPEVSSCRGISLTRPLGHRLGSWVEKRVVCRRNRFFQRGGRGWQRFCCYFVNLQAPKKSSVSSVCLGCRESSTDGGCGARNNRRLGPDLLLNNGKGISMRRSEKGLLLAGVL